jgi:hypothetical protein
VTGVGPLAAHLEGGVLRNGRSLRVLMPVSKGSSITGARVELSGGRVWPRQAVEKWAKATGRTSKDKGYSRAKRPGTGGSPQSGLWRPGVGDPGKSNSTQRPRFNWVTLRWALTPRRGDCEAHGAICGEPLPFGRERRRHRGFLQDVGTPWASVVRMEGDRLVKIEGGLPQ